MAGCQALETQLRACMDTPVRSTLWELEEGKRCHKGSCIDGQLYLALKIRPYSLEC